MTTLPNQPSPRSCKTEEDEPASPPPSSNGGGRLDLKKKSFTSNPLLGCQRVEQMHCHDRIDGFSLVLKAKRERRKRMEGGAHPAAPAALELRHRGAIRSLVAIQNEKMYI